MEPSINYGVGVVLPAAGCGERMKMKTPKQFSVVNGRPLVCFTIDCFHSVPWIQQIVITTSPEHEEALRALVARHGYSKVTVVRGGATRHRSIHAGVTALQKASADIEVAVIHDAVRPLVSADLLRQIAEAAFLHGAAGVCRPLVSTVIGRDGDGVMTESLDRSKYVNSEMPQAFRLPVIADAYSKCSTDDFDFGTECLLLALKHCGVRAKILDGTSDLWKVTYKRDLAAAESILKEGLTRVAVRGGAARQQLAAAIQAQLMEAGLKVEEKEEEEALSQCEEKLPNAKEANTFVIIHPLLSLPTQTNNANVCSEESMSTTKDFYIPTASHVDNRGKAKQNSCDSGQEIVQNTVREAMIENGFGDTVSVSVNTKSTHLNSTDNAKTVLEKDSLNSITTCDVNGGLLHKLRSMQDEQCESRDTTAACTFVHVFSTPNDERFWQVQGELAQALGTLAKERRKSGDLVFGVLAQDGSSSDQVAELTVAVIQRSHATFTGQLFNVF